MHVLDPEDPCQPHQPVSEAPDQAIASWRCRPGAKLLLSREVVHFGVFVGTIKRVYASSMPRVFVRRRSSKISKG
jgi:hypothetical protein